MYKINWNATIDKVCKIMGVGVIVRDDMGTVLAQMCMFVRYIITNQIMAEAYAAWKAMLFSRDTCLQKVIIEVDGMEIIYAF